MRGSSVSRLRISETSLHSEQQEIQTVKQHNHRLEIDNERRFRTSSDTTMANSQPLTGSSLLALFCATATILCLVCAPVAARSGYSGMQNCFYCRSCPNVEKIIYESMYESFKKDSSIAPGVLRLAYHDCFVRVSIQYNRQAFIFLTHCGFIP